MDLKLIDNRAELTSRKNILISDLDTLFDDLISDTNSYKRAALLYYWLRDYKNYIKNEKKFDHKYLPAYQRGSVVNVNMGYNVGSELGGMHFAVVLRDSKVTNPNLTIMPLKSKKDLLQATHPLELDLGNALYNRLIGKHNALRLSAKEKIKEATQGYDRRTGQYHKHR